MVGTRHARSAAVCGTVPWCVRLQIVGDVLFDHKIFPTVICEEHDSMMPCLFTRLFQDKLRTLTEEMFVNGTIITSLFIICERG